VKVLWVTIVLLLPAMTREFCSTYFSSDRK